MKFTSLLQIVDKLQQAGKIGNLQQVCDVCGSVLRKIFTYFTCNRHFPNLLECTQNNSLKLRRGIKAIEIEQFTCSESKFGKGLLLSK